MDRVSNNVAFTAKPFNSDRNKIRSLMTLDEDVKANRIVSETPGLNELPDRDQSNLTVKLADELSDLRKQTALYQVTGNPDHLKYIVDTAKAIDMLAFNRPQ
ncbi:MAG: hypothetical protein AB7V50_06575 [Vampirovibrionia bacterium]